MRCLSPAALPFLEEMAQAGTDRRQENILETVFICLHRFILQIIVRTIVFIVDLTVITISTVHN